MVEEEGSGLALKNLIYIILAILFAVLIIAIFVSKRNLIG